MKISDILTSTFLVKTTDTIPGKIIDRDYQKTATSAGIPIDRVRGDVISEFPIERARLRSIWHFIAISTACTIGYGWALQSTAVTMLLSLCHERIANANKHLAVPLILQFLCGLTVTGTFNVSLRVSDVEITSQKLDC